MRPLQGPNPPPAVGPVMVPGGRTTVWQPGCNTCNPPWIGKGRPMTRKKAIHEALLHAITKHDWSPNSEASSTATSAGTDGDNNVIQLPAPARSDDERYCASEQSSGDTGTEGVGADSGRSAHPSSPSGITGPDSGAAANDDSAGAPSTTTDDSGARPTTGGSRS